MTNDKRTHSNNQPNFKYKPSRIHHPSARTSSNGVQLQSLTRKRVHHENLTELREPRHCAARNYCVTLVSIIIACGIGTVVGYGIFQSASKAKNGGGSGTFVGEPDLTRIGDEIITSTSFSSFESDEVTNKSVLHKVTNPFKYFWQCGRLADGVENPLARFINPDSSPEDTTIPSAVARIIGGLTSDIDSHPWQASLWVRSHTCGGTIISSNWILFTAHCAIEHPHASAWTVYVGISRLSRVFAAQTSKGSDLIIHKSFSTATYDKDIALLRLKKPLKFGRSVRPICLQTISDEVSPGTICQISGWGATFEGGLAVDYLRTTDVKVIDRRVCNRGDWLSGLVNENMICAGSVDGSKDACQGDSGGPLTCFDKERKRFFLEGAVSWGIGCGKPKMPGVYTHIPKLSNWVRSVVNDVEQKYGRIGKVVAI